MFLKNTCDDGLCQNKRNVISDVPRVRFCREGFLFKIWRIPAAWRPQCVSLCASATRKRPFRSPIDSRALLWAIGRFFIGVRGTSKTRPCIQSFVYQFAKIARSPMFTAKLSIGLLKARQFLVATGNGRTFFGVHTRAFGEFLQSGSRHVHCAREKHMEKHMEKHAWSREKQGAPAMCIHLENGCCCFFL